MEKGHDTEKKDETVSFLEQLRQTSRGVQREMNESAPFSPEFWKAKLSHIQDTMKEQSQKGKTEVFYSLTPTAWWKDRGITQHNHAYINKVEKWAIQQGFRVARSPLQAKGMLYISWK